VGEIFPILCMTCLFVLVGLGHAAVKAARLPQRVQEVEAEGIVEVGDGADGRAAGQRDAVEVASAARSSRPSKCQAFHHSRRTIKLSRNSLS